MTRHIRPSRWLDSTVNTEHTGKYNADHASALCRGFAPHNALRATSNMMGPKLTNLKKVTNRKSFITTLLRMRPVWTNSKITPEIPLYFRVTIVDNSSI